MDKKRLKQYRALLNEQKINDKAIDKLYERAAKIPTVFGKVTGSSSDFPYTQIRTTVQMDEPKEADEICRRLQIRETRKEQIRESVVEIEQFISGIPDSIDRQIFESIFLDGKKYREVGDMVGYSKGRVSQKIAQYIKD